MAAPSVNAAYEKYRNQFGFNRDQYHQYCWLRCLSEFTQPADAWDVTGLACKLGIIKSKRRPANPGPWEDWGRSKLLRLLNLGLAKGCKGARLYKDGPIRKAYVITDKGRDWLRAYEGQVLRGEL